MDPLDIFAQILSDEIDQDILKTLYEDSGMEPDMIQEIMFEITKKSDNKTYRQMMGMTNDKIHKEDNNE